MSDHFESMAIDASVETGADLPSTTMAGMPFTSIPIDPFSMF
jgi:hypothetical protein